MNVAQPTRSDSTGGVKEAGSTLRILFRVLDRPTKLRLAVAALFSGVLALLETIAIIVPNEASPTM